MMSSVLSFVKAARLPLLFIFLSMVVLAAAAPLTKGVPLDPTVVIGSLTALTMLGLSFAFARWCHSPEARAALMPDSKTLGRVCIGATIGLALVAANTLIMALTGHVRWEWHPMANFTGVSITVLGFVLLACREELAFRGFPLFKLARDLNPWVAQIFVAVLFALEHLLGGARWDQAIVGAGLGSFVFGMAALRTGGLALPIAIHAAWNIGDWTRGGKLLGGLWVPIVEPGYEHEIAIVGMASYAALSILATILLAQGTNFDQAKGALETKAA